MNNKGQRLAKKNVEHLTPLERKVLRVDNPKPVLDVVMGVAMLWSVANQVTSKVHGFNGGTLEDQVKIIIKNLFNEKGLSEVTSTQILDYWNYRKHGQPHTRQQVSSALTSLKEKGVVVTTGTVPRLGAPGKPATLYALSSVIERLTAPVEEVKETEIISPENLEIIAQNDPDAKIPVGLIFTKLVEMQAHLNRHFTGVGDAFEVTDKSNSEMREAYNKLVTKLHETMSNWREIHDHNQNANNQNTEQFETFANNTNKNFLELQEYFNLIKIALENLTGNFDNRTIVDAELKGYKAGYKEGFADGREEFKTNILAEFRPDVKKEIH